MQAPEKDNNHLISLVKSMKSAPVLVVGDIMLDRFVYGSVDRISPESPVPVLTVQRDDSMLGGAGNALANLAGLEARGFVLSVIGDDQAGREVSHKARELGIDTGGLLVDAVRPTIVKTRFLAGHQQLLRTDFEKKQPLSANVAQDLLKKAEDLIPKVKAVILSDYGKGLLNKPVIAALIALAQKNNVPVIVDPKGQDFSIYSGASAITPNRKELSDATRGLPVQTDDEIIAAAQAIIKDCGIGAVIATRSRDGISVIQDKQDPVHIRRAADIEVFDVSGAGDTVIATVAAALASGSSLAEAATLANEAGSIVVTKVGTAPIRAAELIEGLSESRSRKAPLMDWPAAAEQVRRWRARGLKVGFTNGCFDILHYGHVSYLDEARGRCDRLVIALNKDSSVRILKGANRPVHDEISRAAVLRALGAVDMVVSFGAEKEGQDNTATEIIKLLQPDIYFKGGDYSPAQIPEAPAVLAYGGQVDVMPVYEGHSTTASFQKLKSKNA